MTAPDPFSVLSPAGGAAERTENGAGEWWGRRTLAFNLRDVRIAGGLMLGTAAVRPLVGSPGVPCLLRSLTGIPCPLCGMTTSVTETVWLDLPAAASATPMGIVAVLAAVALLVARRWRSAQAHAQIAVPALALPVVLGGMWLYQLQRFDIL